MPIFLFLSSRGHTVYEVVVRDGHVMDPESGLNVIRNIGIREGKIATLTQNHIERTEVLNATGHVVTAGFIDLHRHGHSKGNCRAQIRNGITSSLDLEIGVEDIESWHLEHEGKTALNYISS